MRPFWVTQPRVQDRETCLCWKHENFQFLLNKLRFLRVVSTADTGQLFRTLCCDVEDKACAYGECSSCKEKKLLSLLTQR